MDSPWNPHFLPPGPSRHPIAGRRCSCRRRWPRRRRLRFPDLLAVRRLPLQNLLPARKRDPRDDQYHRDLCPVLLLPAPGRADLRQDRGPPRPPAGHDGHGLPHGRGLSDHGLAARPARSLQCIAAGGEVGNSFIYLYERTPVSRLGRNSFVIYTATGSSVLLGSLLGLAISSSVSAKDMQGGPSTPTSSSCASSPSPASSACAATARRRHSPHRLPPRKRLERPALDPRPTRSRGLLPGKTPEARPCHSMRDTLHTENGRPLTQGSFDGTGQHPPS